MPILGVCLGHQSIGQATGAEIVRAERLMHGKTDRIHHDGQGLVRRPAQSASTATRYHSLVIRPGTLSDDFDVSAWADAPDGGREIMAIRHKRWPLFGVQFHPESFLTQGGTRECSSTSWRSAQRAHGGPRRAEIEHGVHVPHPAAGTVLTFAKDDQAAED